MLSRPVVSDSLQPHGPQPTRLLSPLEFSRQEYWSGLPCPPPGGVPNPVIKPRFLTLQADSLPTEPPGKPMVSRASTILIRCDSFDWRITAIRVILSRFPKLRLKLKGISSEQQVCGSYQEPMAHLQHYIDSRAS